MDDQPLTVSYTPPVGRPPGPPIDLPQGSVPGTTPGRPPPAIRARDFMARSVPLPWCDCETTMAVLMGSAFTFATLAMMWVRGKRW